MKTLETVKINDPDKEGDFLLINASEFDEAVHTRFGEKPKKAKTPASPPPTDPNAGSGEGDGTEGAGEEGDPKKAAEGDGKKAKAQAG